MLVIVKKSALLILAIALALPASATDLALLQNGFSIRYERRQVLGQLTRLFIDTSPRSGYIDIPTNQITSIERDDSRPLHPAILQPASQPTIHELANSSGGKHAVDPDLIESVIGAESSFNPNAISRKGALGLMQLMPQTASKLGVSNSFDAASNVEGGTRYLGELLLRYHSDMAKALAAYNAGPQRVQQYNGVPPYRETHAYVARVISEFNRRKIAENPALRRRIKTPAIINSAHRPKSAVTVEAKARAHSVPNPKTGSAD